VANVPSLHLVAFQHEIKSHPHGSIQYTSVVFREDSILEWQ